MDLNTNSRWISAPKNGEVCSKTGLGHSAFYRAFSNNPNVRQCKPGVVGRKRGKRVFYLADILEYLDALASRERTKTLSID